MPEIDQPRNDIISVLQRDIKVAHTKADHLKNESIINPNASPTHVRAGMGVAGLAVTANAAYLSPIENLYRKTDITKIVFKNTLGGAGNYDVGIYYSDDEINFYRLYSSGSLVNPGIATVITSIPKQTLVPTLGRRWLFASAWTTSTSPVQETQITIGYAIASTFPLPAVIVGPVLGSSYPAIIGMY